MAHYFDESPASDARRKTLRVTLADREVSIETASGVFSPGHIDLGTRQLLRAANDLPETGTFVDLGCGWGPIALDMALRRPEARIFAIDVNERALALTAANAGRLGLPNVHPLPAEQALADDRLTRIDVLRSNPPIRIGKTALHELLTQWLPRLAPHGLAELVVAKNLGADSLAGWIEQALGMSCEKQSSRKGFRILAVTHAG